MPPTSETCASYVPAHVARQFTSGSAPPTEPRAELLTGAMMFADISGFTALTEGLARHGAVGVEEVTQCLNVYLGQLIDLITEHGGDVLKFAGDALLALWPVGDDDLPTAVARATRCGLATQDRLHDFQAAAGVRLSLRIGIGAGPISLFHVGGVNGRWELVATGASLTQMSSANQQDRPGDVTLSPEAWALIRERAEGDALPGGAVCVRAFRGALPPVPADPPLADDSPALLSYVPLTVVHHLASDQSSWLAELRPISVLFVNFPGLSPLTPLDRSQSIMRDLQTILYRYEAIINKISVDDKGASLVAAMGLPPLAHEDDAARAVAAALAIRDRLCELQVRHAIGIASGLAFCGVVGNARRREYTVMGDVVNLSARLMQAAPDDVLCDRATYDASRSRQAFEALPAIHVKGKANPVNVYRPHAGAVQPDALRGDKAAAVVGRLPERFAIGEALRALVSNGTGGTLVLEGEAGIGKSRLIEELIVRARDASVSALVGAGDSMERSTPYFAWRRVFFHLFGLEIGASKEERAARAAARLDAAGHPEWTGRLPLLNPVLLTDFADTSAITSMNDRDRAAATHDFLSDVLANLSEAGSRTVVIVDNAHWMDSASWKLAVSVTQRPAPIVAVFSVRPMGTAAPEEFQAICHATGARRIRLEGLSPDDAVDVARGVLGVTHLPPPVEQVIRVKAEGNPLFIQELANAMRDAQLIWIADGECRLSPAAGDLRSVDLPDSVQAAVVARIDRLSPSQRMLLKVASVVGRVFESAVIEALNPVDADSAAIAEDLGALAAMEITALERSEPAAVYAFAQLIFQEVSYNLMLFSQRRQLHRAMAEWLERANVNQLEAVYPLLAAHWTKAIDEGAAEAAIVRKAVDYSQKAAEQAVRQYANQEAVAFFSEALRLVDLLPDTPERTRTELALCCAMGAPLCETKGFAAPETEQTYARAWELCKEMEQTPERFGTVLGLWVFYLVKTELRRARELAEELLRSAEASEDPGLRLPAHRVMGETSFWLGDQQRAREHLEQAIAIYRPELHHAPSVARNGQDPGVICRTVSAWSLWLLGYPDAAVARLEEALALAHQLAHPFSVAMALQNFTMTHQFRREPSAALEKAEMLIEVSREGGFALWHAGGTIMRGWALSEVGQPDLGRAEMRRGIENWRATGAELPVGYYRSLLANAYGAAGEAAQGLGLVREAIAASNRSEERWWQAELWRIEAELSLLLPEPDVADAERCLAQALAVSRRQQARSLELRAALSLFRLRRAQRNADDEARRALIDAKEWFTEGTTSADYQEAVRLLAADRPSST